MSKARTYFHDEERAEICKLVNQHPVLKERKLTHNIRIQKMRAWKQICQSYNSGRSTDCIKTTEQLRKCYSNMKSKSRKKYEKGNTVHIDVTQVVSDDVKEECGDPSEEITFSPGPSEVGDTESCVEYVTDADPIEFVDVASAEVDFEDSNPLEAGNDPALEREEKRRKKDQEQRKEMTLLNENSLFYNEPNSGRTHPLISGIASISAAEDQTRESEMKLQLLSKQIENEQLTHLAAMKNSEFVDLKIKLCLEEHRKKMLLLDKQINYWEKMCRDRNGYT